MNKYVYPLIGGIILSSFGIFEATRYFVYDLFPKIIAYRDFPNFIGDVSHNPTIYPIIILFILGFLIVYSIQKYLVSKNE